MDNIQFFKQHFLLDKRKDFTATIHLRYSRKPGFELIGHGQLNEGFGFRHYLLDDGEFYGIRDNQTRMKRNGYGVTSVTESSIFCDYSGLMDRYFGTVLVHLALELHAKITVKFTSDTEYKARDLPPSYVGEFGYLGKGRGHYKVFTPETVYEEQLLKQLMPPNKKAEVVLTDRTIAVLDELPYKLSEIMDHEETFEYTSVYQGKNHTRKY